MTDSKNYAKISANTNPVLRSEELFSGGKLVLIEHQGECYRLAITKQGKLILTK